MTQQWLDGQYKPEAGDYRYFFHMYSNWITVTIHQSSTTSFSLNRTFPLDCVRCLSLLVRFHRRPNSRSDNDNINNTNIYESGLKRLI